MTQALALTSHDDGTLDQLRAVRNALAPDLNDQELQLFAMVAARSGLDPFAKQIYAVKRAGRVTFQTGIDGYRSIAARTGEYDGQDEPEFGPACSCNDAPKGHPEFATVRVHRKGMSRPVGATAYWHEYVPQGNQGQMWHRMPRVMLSKVAEALALRKAFPWDPNRGAGIGADLYTADEMAQAERSAPGTTAATRAPTAAARVAQRRAALAPATDAPHQPENAEPPTGGAGDENAAAAAADETEGEVREVPAGLTKQQLVEGLNEAGISVAFATERGKVLFPPEARADGKNLDDTQRAALLADVTADPSL